MYDKKPIIKSIQEFVMSCPCFQGQAEEAEPGTAAECFIEPVHADTIYRQYTDGNVLRQYLFTLTTKKAYDAQAREQLAANGFGQYFEEWLEEQNSKDIYPQLDGYAALRMESMTSGYLAPSETGLAGYQILCRLIYK